MEIGAPEKLSSILWKRRWFSKKFIIPWRFVEICILLPEALILLILQNFPPGIYLSPRIRIYLTFLGDRPSPAKINLPFPPSKDLPYLPLENIYLTYLGGER